MTQNFLSVTLALLGLFMFAEFALRVGVAARRRKLNNWLTAPKSWGNQYAKPNYFVAHPYIGYIKKKMCSDERYPSNNLGYAGKKDIPLQKKKGTIRIYVCGDSTVEQNDYDFTPPFDSEVTWPYLMEKKISSVLMSDGADIEVINAACSAYTTMESLIEFQLRGLYLDIDYALFCHNLTDIWLAQAIQGYKSDYSHSRKHPVFPCVGWLPDFPYSYVYQYLKKIMSGCDDSILQYVMKRFPFKTEMRGLDRKRETFTSNLRSFCAICLAHNVTPVLVQWNFEPALVRSLYGHDLSEDDLKLFVAGMAAHNSIMRDIVNEFPGACLINPGEFEAHHFRDGDWMHWSLSGLVDMGERVGNEMANLINAKKF
jgi:hypothetical protein